MKYTLLELCQRILGSMESDEVSTISETPESRDVVAIIKECFYDIVGQGNLAEQVGLFKLDASTDDTKPVLMYIPRHVVKMDWLKYNFGTLLHPDWKILRYIDPEEFIAIQTGMDEANTETQSLSIQMDGDSYVFRYRNNRIPTYYTIFEDRYVVFDSSDSTMESTLTQVRSLGYGLRSPEFREEDDFVPDLDHRQFQLLLQDAKATAHVELKQQQNPKAEQKYRRNFILSQKTKNDNDPSASRQAHYQYGRMRTYGRVRHGRT